jgi:signal transduction histidine kinase
VADKDEYLGIMKIFYNLTREKIIDKMKSEFISIAAHQLRTPLSAIKWVIKMILDGDAGKLNDEQKNLLSQGYASNERIIALVNDMLNVSRIEEGRFGYSFTPDKLDEALDIVVKSLANQIANKKIKLDLFLPPKLPMVYMDKQKMVLVLQNILENAVKYTPEHGKIDIKVKNTNDNLEIAIKDNGVGIPQNDQAKLFSKFFRASNVMRMQAEGSGLGLFIVKNIIEKHGGTIICKSEEGHGTEFVFTLPLDSKVKK